MYSPDNWEITSEVFSVVCITAISLYVGRKIASIDGPVYLGHALLIALYSVSWAFVTAACMLTSTNNDNVISCSLAIFNLIIFYTASKVTLYLYFIEKIFIISVPRTPRLRSTLYIVNLLLLVPFAALIVVMSLYRISSVAVVYPYHCSIGLSLPVGVAVIAYNFLLNVFYLCVFVKLSFFPGTVQQTTPHSSSLNLMAKRNLFLSAVSIILTLISLIVAIVNQDGQRGLTILLVSSIDLTLLCSAAQWVSSHPADLQCTENTLQRANGDMPVKLEIKQHQEVVVLTELSYQR